MKLNTIPKPALILLIAGLLMTTTMPIISKHFLMPDFVKGFMTGLGLTLELMALVKIQRNRSRKCTMGKY
ncbi:hypothetical protein MUGA111182_13245 [Mucilaginibacter galii]|uniref:Uncharacterized protein n=1 Tax=Mucilaginibacter galii TaxID=2005073 RepID=A0A917MZR4_9SPHI|nr:hypothetical protein [Mucilaginibacter galii]GGI49266.1 hypothetical protein GCM10011425_04780 [Mucilaginibacter galii]